MREEIIKRILALPEEKAKELLTLIRELESEELPLQVPHQTSA